MQIKNRRWHDEDSRIVKASGIKQVFGGARQCAVFLNHIIIFLFWEV